MSSLIFREGHKNTNADLNRKVALNIDKSNGNLLDLSNEPICEARRSENDSSCQQTPKSGRVPLISLFKTLFKQGLVSVAVYANHEIILKITSLATVQTEIHNEVNYENHQIMMNVKITPLDTESPLVRSFNSTKIETVLEVSPLAKKWRFNELTR